MKELDPRKLTMENAMAAMSGHDPAAMSGLPPNLVGMGRSAQTPPDPEREAFDKWWDRKSSEPLNYKDIKHYAWSAWIESAYHTLGTIKERVEKL